MLGRLKSVLVAGVTALATPTCSSAPDTAPVCDPVGKVTGDIALSCNATVALCGEPVDGIDGCGNSETILDKCRSNFTEPNQQITDPSHQEIVRLALAAGVPLSTPEDIINQCTSTAAGMVQRDEWFPCIELKNTLPAKFVRDICSQTELGIVIPKFDAGNITIPDGMPQLECTGFPTFDERFLDCRDVVQVTPNNEVFAQMTLEDIQIAINNAIALANEKIKEVNADVTDPNQCLPSFYSEPVQIFAPQYCVATAPKSFSGKPSSQSGSQSARYKSMLVRTY